MRFIALPVSQGDAFYAETDDGFRVLVDGGRARRALPELFRTYVRKNIVDVLVCTHNDADHAEGVIGFLESGLRCKELWLPATWLDALRALPPDPHQTLGYLWDRLQNFRSVRLEAGMTEDDLQDAAWRALVPEMDVEHLRHIESERQRSYADEDNGPTVLSHALQLVIPALEPHRAFLRWATPWHAAYWVYGPWYGRHAVVPSLRIIKDAVRLIEIAVLALQLGIPVRCFLHDPPNATLVSRYPLRPLSGPAVRYLRVVRHQRTADVFFALAALTTANRQSLVSYLRGDTDPAGVLFTADSDLQGVNLGAVASWSIATAPHHGSGDNRDAYTRISAPMVWVRSDGYSTSRPCSEYLNAAGRRFCTLCRNSSRPKQAVRMYSKVGSWVRYRTAICECR